MENASKALMMAGQILIALLILSLLVYAYNSLSNYTKSQQEQTEIEQLAVFNKEYESYNRKLLRGVDVISVIYKAIDNNARYENEEYYKIDVTFEMAESLAYVKDGNRVKKISGVFKVGQSYTMEEFVNNIKTNTDAFTDFKRRIFDCTDIKYNNKSGRVCNMHFVERKMTDQEYEGGL